MYDELEKVEWRQYTGLDDKTLDLLEKVDVASLGEANLEFASAELARTLIERFLDARSCVDHVSRLGRSGRSQTPACQWIILRFFILTSCDYTKSIPYGSH